MQEEVCWTAFRAFDQDGDGKLCETEILKVLTNENVKDVVDVTVFQSVRSLIDSADSSGDGFICFDEFMFMLTGKKAKSVSVTSSSA